MKLLASAFHQILLMKVNKSFWPLLRDLTWFVVIFILIGVVVVVTGIALSLSWNIGRVNYRSTIYIVWMKRHFIMKVKTQATTSYRSLYVWNVLVVIGGGKLKKSFMSTLTTSCMQSKYHLSSTTVAKQTLNCKLKSTFYTLLPNNSLSRLKSWYCVPFNRHNFSKLHKIRDAWFIEYQDSCTTKQLQPHLPVYEDSGLQELP